MIFRVTQKLAKKLKTGSLPAKPMEENPFADWSANLFLIERTQYILITNTKSLYSTIVTGNGITDEGEFIDRALNGIGQQMEFDKLIDGFRQHIVPTFGTVQFASMLSRSVTGSMNDHIRGAKLYFSSMELSPSDVCDKLNLTPMSALGGGEYSKWRDFGIPRDIMVAMIERAPT